MTVINWLNSNSGAIVAVATIVLAIITWRYVSLTNRLIKASTNTPQIAIHLTPIEGGPNRFILFVENIGTGAAHGVEFSTDLSFKIDGLHSLEDVGFIKDGISYLQPKGKMGFTLILADRLRELKETPLKISVTYKDSDSEKYPDCFLLKFGEFINPSYGNRLFMTSISPER